MKHLFTLLLCGVLAPLTAQKSYFQQEVNYTIAVALDDRAHTLSGNISIEYINHSPDALAEIWLHCWPNAFDSRKSAFTRQKLRQADGEFYFAPDSSRGRLEKLDFQVNGQKASWSYDPANPDIARLTLPQPLAPGARLTITTPLVVKIPASFSRLGHVGESYQITQWFPKPAVYDARGWHPIPYLDQGEFYSEFGSFDVSITLPDNYVVGATGTLKNPAELDFLRQKEQATREKIKANALLKHQPHHPKHKFPPSSATTKTLRFTAENVHDFAWFADKRFNVLHDTARLASGKTVDCWAMFSDEDLKHWDKGAFYVRRAVEFYSEHVGEYPWPHATAVHSALSAGGGMEYPMITVIGPSNGAADLDEVITHEVGHNWFYGILASNERDHPWMDEGINTYYELRYMRQYYGQSTVAAALPKRLYDPEKNGPLLYQAYLILARDHQDTPPDSHSERFTPAGYGLQVYMKTALTLGWLEKSVGTEKFDAAMQAYYRSWKFRHPYPEDLRASWQQSGISADWFFKAMQTQQQTDYALKKVEPVVGGYRLTVKNRKELNAPFPVTALRDGQPVATQWYPAPAQNVETVVMSTPDADAFVIDRDFATLDSRHQNNSRRTGGLFPGAAPLQLKFFAPAENPNRRVIGFSPWVGWNNYDKTMIGLVFYNPPFPGQRLQYYLAPAFATGPEQLAGLADLRYHFYPGGAVPKLTLGFSAKSFHFDFRQDEFWRYLRLVPQVRAELRSRSLSYRHWVNFRTLFIDREVGEYDREGQLSGKDYTKSTIYEARYEAVQKRLPHPFRFTAALEWQAKPDSSFVGDKNYLRGSLEWRQQFYYREKKKITVRAFVGAFLRNSRVQSAAIQPEAFALNPQGFNDYRFDQVYLGRSENEGFLSQQVSQTDGCFKNAFGSAFAGYTNSNSFLAALNLKADLPFRLPLPIKPYFDLGYFEDATPLGRPADERFLWSGGLMLEFFQGSVEFYFPLVNAKPLQDLYQDRGGYGARITWSVRLGAVEPRQIVDNMLH